MSKYVDICMTYEILLKDSGLLPSGEDEWNTFEPKENDLALVTDEKTVYIFTKGEWKQYE